MTDISAFLTGLLIQLAFGACWVYGVVHFAMQEAWVWFALALFFPPAGIPMGVFVTARELLT